MNEEYVEVLRWTPDNKPETTDAIVVVNRYGVVKRLQYRRWDIRNKTYSIINEHVYTQSTNRGKQRKDSTEKIAKCGLYHYVGINRKNYSVHRLVAIAFLPNPKNLEQVNHKDGDRSNNHVDNLEWSTGLDNISHAIENKLFPNYKKGMTLSPSDKKLIVKLASEGMSTARISSRIDKRMSHEGIRLFIKQEIPDYKVRRKQRPRQSVEERRVKQKETRLKNNLQNIKNLMSTEKAAAVVQLRIKLYSVQEISNITGESISIVKSICSNIENHEEISQQSRKFTPTIKSVDAGITKKGKSFRFRVGRTFAKTFKTKHQAIEFKLNYIENNLNHSSILYERWIKLIRN